MNHFVNDDIFEEIARLFDEFGVETNMPAAMVTASPPGFHPLEKVAGDFNVQLDFPLLYERWYQFMKKGFMPLVDNLPSLCFVAAWPHCKCDALVVKANRGLGFSIIDGQQVAAAPQGMAFALDELARGFARLLQQFLLLSANPIQFADGVGSRHIGASRGGGYQSDATIGRVDGEMDIFNVLHRDPNRKFAELDNFAGQ